MANILLIDDDIVDLMAIQRHLKTFTTHQFTFASSLEEATQLLNQQSFDIIFSDYHLGDGLAIELKPLQATPIVLITGMNEIPSDILKEGFEHILIKTIHNDHLHEIGNIIQSRFGGSDNAVYFPPPSKMPPLEQLSISFKDDPSYYQIMLYELKSQLEQASTKLNNLEDNNFSACFEISHKLKSQFNLGGFDSEANIAARLEQLCKETPTDSSKIPDLLKALQEAIPKAIKLIEKKLTEIT